MGKTYLIGATVAFLAACGGSDEGSSENERSISSSEASVVSQTTVGVAAQIEEKLFNVLDGTLGDRLAGLKDWFSGTPENFTIDGTLDNPKGGSVTITGLGSRTPRETCGGIAGTLCPDGQRCVLESKSPDATGQCFPASAWTIELTVTFSDWVVEEADMVLNGSIALDYEIQAAAPRSFLMIADGTLTVGPPLPVKVKLTVTAKDKQLSVCGSIAGVPVDNGNCS